MTGVSGSWDQRDCDPAAQFIDALDLPCDPNTLAATLEPIRARSGNCGACLTKIEMRAIHRRTIRQFWFELAFGVGIESAVKSTVWELASPAGTGMPSVVRSRVAA